MEKMVTLALSEMSFLVTGKTEQELVDNAKRAMLESLQKEFPGLTYSINDPDVLTEANAMSGMIVETIRGGFLGIVTTVNKKTINVTLTGNRSMSGPPQAFKKSDASFEQARSKRRDKEEWYEGDSGYIQVGEEIKEVVVGKKSGQKTKLHVINSEKYLSVTDQQMKAFLKDEKSELE